MTNSIKVTIPEAFCQRMQVQLSNDYDTFISSLDTNPPISIRAHPVKGNALQVDTSTLSSIPWCKNGFYLEQRPVFTLDPGFHAGAYYVQEASSMSIDFILRQLLTNTEVKVLDLCAAPGGKSTIISSILSGNGLLVSNETIGGRLPSLVHNIIKWGYPNQIITSSDPERFKGLKGFFDIVLVDAPCSGEGLFRKDPSSRKEWSEKIVSQCELRQTRILESARHAVKPGGYLIYSTCTYNPGENNNQIIDLVKSGWTCIDFKELKAWGFEELLVNGTVGYQAYSHKVGGEGFFVSVLVKPKEAKYESSMQKNLIDWIKKTPIPDHYLSANTKFDFFEHKKQIHFIPSSYSGDLEILSQYLRIISAGTQAGEFKGNDFIPDHALSQSIYLNPDIITKVLNKEEALEYLKRLSLVNPNEQRGYVVSRYKNYSLGWLKGIQGRYNNLYPNEYRIMGNFDS